jgi:hypothetical protein
MLKRERTVIRPSDIVPTNLTSEIGQIAMLGDGCAQSRVVRCRGAANDDAGHRGDISLCDEQDRSVKTLVGTLGRCGELNYVDGDADALGVVKGWYLPMIRTRNREQHTRSCVKTHMLQHERTIKVLHAHLYGCRFS